jgi:hypothetical protein
MAFEGGSPDERTSVLQTIQKGLGLAEMGVVVGARSLKQLNRFSITTRPCPRFGRASFHGLGYLSSDKHGLISLENTLSIRMAGVACNGRHPGTFRGIEDYFGF